jgi:hypothetical protein
MSIDQQDRIPNLRAENDIDVELAEKLVRRSDANPATHVALADDPADDVIGIVGTSRDTGKYIQVLGQGYYEFLADGSGSRGDRLTPTGTTDKEGYVQASDDPAHTFCGYALHDFSDGDLVHAEFRVREHTPALALTPGSEGDVVADAFDIGIQQTPAETGKWEAVAYSQDGTVATDIDFSLQDGDGTEINASGSQRLIFELPADGQETLRALDGSGAIAADVELVVRPLDADGAAIHETLTYS